MQEEGRSGKPEEGQSGKPDCLDRRDRLDRRDPAEMTIYRICRILSRAAAKPIFKKNGSSGPTDLKPAEISHQLHGEGNPLGCACGMRGPSPYGKRHAFFPRRAGACPPRVLDPREKRTQTNAVFRSDRGTARDRPSPYGETETALHTVAREPIPRERSREKRLFRSFRSCMSIVTPDRENPKVL